MTGRKLVRLALGCALAALFVWLLLRNVDTARIAQVWSQAQAGWLLAAALVLCAGYGSRIARWHLMLVRSSPGLRVADCAGPLLASFAAKQRAAAARRRPDARLRVQRPPAQHAGHGAGHAVR